MRIRPRLRVTALLKAIVASHEHEQGSRVEITGSDAPLAGNALTSLALLLHEPTTNAAKYNGIDTFRASDC
jgi:two-component sensor histidine kinase